MKNLWNFPLPGYRMLHCGSSMGFPRATPAGPRPGFKWGCPWYLRWQILGYHGMKLGMPGQIPYGIQLGNTGQSWYGLPWDEAGHARTNPVRDSAGQYRAKLVWSTMG